MPSSLASLYLPHTLFSLGPARIGAWTCTDPAHHYPCSRCLILWPSITIQASNETLLVSSSPDIAALLQRLRYAIIQAFLHARIGGLQPWILNKHAYLVKTPLQGGLKMMSIFLSQLSLWHNDSDSGPPKEEIYRASTWKQCCILSKWRLCAKDTAKCGCNN